MQRKFRARLALVGVGAMLALPVHSQNFSCRIGTSPACLDYGDQVCASGGKCVNSSSVCFDQYQCNYEGCTCKSNMTQCVDEHSALVRRYNDLLSDNNDLVDTYNALLTRNNELVAKYNGLLNDYDDLLTKSKALAAKHDALNDCLRYASAMEDGETCLNSQ